MSIAEKLETVAENEQKVFDAGYNKGYPDGYGEGEEIGYTNGSASGYVTGYEEGYQYGKEAGMNDSVRWDDIQYSGKRAYYRDAFAYFMWDACDPKYTIKADTLERTFYYNVTLENINWDKVDVSDCESFYQAFYTCQRLVSVDADLAATGTVTTVYNHTFRNCYALQRVQKITSVSHALWTDCFWNCHALTDITFDGVIANSINFQHSPLLSYDSIQSIIRALSTTATGKTITLSKTAVNNAYNMDVDDETVWEDDTNEMATWVKYYSNWTFSFV